MRGTVTYLKHCLGEFLSSIRADSTRQNESVLIRFDPAEAPGEKMPVRLVAGMIPRRILPWVWEGEEIQSSERIGMLQFSSRCEWDLPLTAKGHLEGGDKVKGGETIVASFG